MLSFLKFTRFCPRIYRSQLPRPSSNPERRMPKVGFYAVRVGREIGIYNSWEECKNQTQGYPNARYKRFDNLKEAECFIQPLESSSGPTSSTVPKRKKISDAEIEDESHWEVVYTDGACKGNGKPGSIAGVGVWWDHGDPRNIAERCPGTQTNNRAELIAILRALETTPLSKTPFLIKTDSQYSIDCFQKWIHNWKKNNWKSATGGSVKNEGIIRCISLHLDLRSRCGQPVRLQHVKGHSGEVGNEGADTLANEGTLKPLVQERDWEDLEVRLQKELDRTDMSVAFGTSVEVPVLINADGPSPIQPLPKSRKLGDVVFPSHNRIDDESSLLPISTTPDVLQAEQQPPTIRSETPSTRNEETSIANFPEVSERRVFDPPDLWNVSRDCPNTITHWPSQSHFSHVQPSAQSPVRVLYAAPPLIPVKKEDVNFEDYADCVLDDEDLVLELNESSL